MLNRNLHLSRLRIRHFNRFLFHPFGIHVDWLDKSAQLPGLLKFLLKKQIDIGSVFDVGAFKGAWSNEVRSYFPKASYYLFEPNEIHNSSITKHGFEPLNLLLGKKSKIEVNFYTRGQTGDSYFVERNSEYIGTQKKMLTTTLSDFVESRGLRAPDFLKLDTQGSELDILKGFAGYLSQIKIILVELPITSFNVGAPTLSEVVFFLDSQNFVPVYLSEIHNVIGVLAQVDIAFMHRDLFKSIFGHDDISHRDIFV
jgi:FkbM family methyltransferase